MALRDKLAQRAVPFLEPGEQIQAIFIAQSGASPYWSFVSTWIVLLTRGFVTVVATDRAIVVLRNGWFTSTRPQSLLARLPRQPMDEPSGLWATLHLDGRRYWLHRRFHKDVRAANTAMLGGAPTGYTY
ncbi:MAG TPA: hypothetical protein VMU95_07625 [Trebonia sp.]|nr:hypothetical protein [Trebonia sp.]